MPKFRYMFHQTEVPDVLLRTRYVEDPAKVSEQTLVKLCPKCRRWVSKSDWEDWCSHGKCEFSTEVTLQSLVRNAE